MTSKSDKSPKKKKSSDSFRQGEDRFNAGPDALSVIRDMDALKKTEEALEISEARFRELFNNMSSGVVVFRVEGKGRDFVFVDFNRAAERIEKVKREDVVGRSVLKTFPSIKKVGLFEALQRVWKTGVPERYPVLIYKKDQLKIWKENYIFKLPSGEIIDVYDDITERKIAEEKLLDYQEQLRSLSAELALAEEHERRSIATELHDQIGQTLSVLNMKLYSLREGLTDKDSQQEVDEIQEGLKNVIRSTRSLTFELSPPVLYELGLEAALEWLGEQFQRQHGLVCSFEDDGGEKDLAEDVKIVLFRSVRELLVNVVKHAGTDRAWINVCRAGDCIRIEVEDKGSGFDLQKKERNVSENYGFGLFNIRERLSHLGANLDIDTRPGLGTLITIVAPLNG